MNTLLPLLGIGVFIVGALAFWASIQNWIANLIHQARTQLGIMVEPAQTALVLIDRAIVNGQRVAVLTGRVIFKSDEVVKQPDESLVVQEVREIDPQALPADILSRFEKTDQVLTYEVAIGRNQARATRRLEVKREDD